MKINILKSIFFSVFTVSFFPGCEGIGIPSTDNPLIKLAQAQELYNTLDRPLPAERLIRQAIQICEKKKDNICLAKANIEYGFFFRSPSVERHIVRYTKSGFLDKSATYNDRYSSSLKYFEKSTKLLDNTQEYGLLTNAYLNLGFAYGIIKNTRAECNAYNKSLIYNLKNIRTNKNTKISLPNGESSFREYVEKHKNRAGCH